MNQIITDNRNKIDTACQLCFYTLDKYHKAVQEFNEEKRKIEATPYIQQEQERMVNRAAEGLSNTVNGYYAEISRNLKDIRIAASEMENLLDIGTDLQNALSVVKALGKDMPSETCLNMVEQFKGQRQALVILKASFETSGIIATDKYFEGLIFNSSDVLDDLDDSASRIVGQPGTNMLVAINFGRKLEEFAENMGVKLTKKFGDIVDTSGALNAQMRAVMGLVAAE